MFIKKLCLSILAMMLLFPSAIFAEEDDVKIGNLWYNLIDKAKVAEVTERPNLEETELFTYMSAI